MSTTSITKGSVLFLRPEDVSTSPETGFYVMVASVTRNSVTATAAGDEGPLGRHVVPHSVAVLRVVPAEEVSGNRISTWLRRGVACVDGPDVVFEQVVNVGSDAVELSSVAGSRWLPLGSVVCPVHPVTAMILFDGLWPHSHWSERVVNRVNERLLGLLRGPVDHEPDVGSIDEAIPR